MCARGPFVRVTSLSLHGYSKHSKCRKHNAILCTAILREKGHEFVAGGNDWSLEQDQRFGLLCAPLLDRDKGTLTFGLFILRLIGLSFMS